MIFGDDMTLFFDSGRTGREKFQSKEGIVKFARVILIRIFRCISFQVLIELTTNSQTFVHIMTEIPTIDKHGKGDIWFSIEGILYDWFDYIFSFVFTVLHE
jgi:hypothetical protein